MATIDLRKKTAPQQRRAPGLPLPVGLLTPGKNFKPTPEEERVLRAAGWNPGDPIPTSIPDILKKEIEQAENSLPLPPDTPPLKVSAPVQFDSLTPDKKKELTEAMSQARQQLAAFGEMEAQRSMNAVEGAGPGINEAIQVAAKSLNIPVTNSESKATTEPAKPAESGASVEVSHCQRCGHDLKQDTPDVSREDMLGFLQSFLGQIRFRKQFSLFGGSVQLVLRTLTTEEADLAYLQAAMDSSSGFITDDKRYLRTLADYRCVLSIESLHLGDKRFNLPESLEEWHTDSPEKGKTRLYDIYQWIYQNILTTDSIRKVVGSTYWDFEKYVGVLESKALDPNFYKAIEQQP